MFKRPMPPKPGGDALVEQLARSNTLRKKQPAPAPRRTESGEVPAVKGVGGAGK